jgi:hypothetical protein
LTSLKLATGPRASQQLLCVPPQDRLPHRLFRHRSRSWKTWSLYLITRRKPIPPLFLAASRRSASPRDTRNLSSDDEIPEAYDDHSSSKMSAYHPPSRPLSVAIPDGLHPHAHAHFYPSRPSLDDILSNTSAPPWTLSAFMAYLSQNHCLETLEFTMDAKRYRQHYEKMLSKNGGQCVAGDDAAYVLSLWHRLMQAYIRANGPREVNLPSEVRDELLAHDGLSLPPHPDALNAASDKVHELMEESVLVPFLNSLCPQSNHADSNASSTEDLVSSSFEDRRLFRSRNKKNNRRRRSPNSGSPPLSAQTSTVGFSSPIAVPNRASAPNAITQFARSLSQSASRNAASPPASHSPPRPLSIINAPAMWQAGPTSDSVTPDTPDAPAGEEVTLAQMLASPADDTKPSLVEPMTPPRTPPAGDISMAGGTSPVLGGAVGATRSANPWKKMRYSFTWRKKSDQNHDLDGP